MMTRAAATIDSFDLYRMGRLHQVLAEMLREDVDVKRASDLMDQLERESSPWPWWVVVLGGMVLAAGCLRNRDDIGLCGNHRHGAGTPTSNSSDRPSRSVKSEE